MYWLFPSLCIAEGTLVPVVDISIECVLEAVSWISCLCNNADRYGAIWDRWYHVVVANSGHLVVNHGYLWYIKGATLSLKLVKYAPTSGTLCYPGKPYLIPDMIIIYYILSFKIVWYSYWRLWRESEMSQHSSVFSPIVQMIPRLIIKWRIIKINQHW